MTWYANKKQTERYYDAEDEVYLKLQPYRQGFVIMRRNQN